MTDLDVTNDTHLYEGGIVTDLTGKDISGVTFKLALGKSLTDAPTTGWADPDINDPGPGKTLKDGTIIPPNAQRILKKLIAPPTGPGDYYVWFQYIDNPEKDTKVFPWKITVK